LTSGRIIHRTGTTLTTAQSSELAAPAGRPISVKNRSSGLQMQKRSSRCGKKQRGARSLACWRASGELALPPRLRAGAIAPPKGGASVLTWPLS
jgi:hypothetical protein